MMIKGEGTRGIESLVARMRELSEEEQHTLAGIVLNDCKLEPFVEEIDDNLICERAVAEEDPGIV